MHDISGKHGFSHGINKGLDWVFRAMNADYCLCPGSDTIMPPSYYRLLLDLNLPVVSGVQDIDGHRVTLEDLDKQFPVQPINPNPDFSCLRWRKEAWRNLVGGRIHGELRLRLRSTRPCSPLRNRDEPRADTLLSLWVEYHQERSSEREKATRHASRCRPAYFCAEMGFTVGSPQYAAQFSPEAFRCENK